MAEAVFLRYTRADGVRGGTSPDESTSFDFEASPRITLGYAKPSGLGVRVRYWEYDQFEESQFPPEGVGIDTYTIDVEVYESFLLGRCWCAELAGGVRYNEFEEQLINTDLKVNSFHGWGGVLGAELTRKLGCYGALYGRVRGAILVDDKFILDDGGDQIFLSDVNVGVVELGLGYEVCKKLACGSTLFARGGMEWQTWYNYSSAFEDTSSLDDFSGPSDVGFYGPSVAVGFYR
jgi:hypothetical protein